jgi:hypothetical protein
MAKPALANFFLRPSFIFHEKLACKCVFMQHMFYVMLEDKLPNLLLLRPFFLYNLSHFGVYITCTETHPEETTRGLALAYVESSHLGCEKARGLFS